MRRKPTVVSTTDLKFTIFVEWPSADVDVVLTRMSSTLLSGPQSRVADHRTPKEGSVDRMLVMVYKDEELKQAGIEVEEWSGFMMGCCHMVFKVDANRLGDLPDLIKLAERRMRAAVRRYVRYYRDRSTVQNQAVAVVTFP